MPNDKIQVNIGFQAFGQLPASILPLPLKTASKLLYAVLWAYCYQKTAPSVRQLAADCSCSPRHLRSCLRELEAAGLLKTSHNFKEESVYTLQPAPRHKMQAPPASPAAPPRHQVPGRTKGRSEPKPESKARAPRGAHTPAAAPKGWETWTSKTEAAGVPFFWTAAMFKVAEKISDAVGLDRLPGLQALFLKDRWARDRGYDLRIAAGCPSTYLPFETPAQKIQTPASVAPPVPLAPLNPSLKPVWDKLAAKVTHGIEAPRYA